VTQATVVGSLVASPNESREPIVERPPRAAPSIRLPCLASRREQNDEPVRLDLNRCPPRSLSRRIDPQDRSDLGMLVQPTFDASREKVLRRKIIVRILSQPRRGQRKFNPETGGGGERVGLHMKDLEEARTQGENPPDVPVGGIWSTIEGAEQVSQVLIFQATGSLHSHAKCSSCCGFR
jgi:hypothetical protein